VRGKPAVEFGGVDDGAKGRGFLLPSVETLVLSLPMPDSDGFHVGSLNLRAETFSSLRHLDLRGSKFYSTEENTTLLGALANTDLAGQLESLALPSLDDDDKPLLDSSRFVQAFPNASARC
jgi:hypothetical protein